MAVTVPAFAEPLARQDATMRYRPLGKSGLLVSALSFGCMRLKDDPELNLKLIGRALDLGINYFETTRYYLGGTCQQRTAPGLKGRTAGIIVSGKEGINPDKTAYLFLKEIERQLDILGLTHFKFFQVGWFSWAMIPHLLKRGGVLDAVRQAQDRGLIQRLGFTGHDTPENFIKCIETGLFDCITVPYNLIARQYEPTINRAGELGVGVVAMCPVSGGVLAEGGDKLREATGCDLPTPEMALRFVLSNPNISTACSGMNTLEMLEQNARTAREFDPAAGTHEAMCAGLDKLRAGLGDKYCTNCRYCMPCEHGVDIPRHMDIYRLWKCFDLEPYARKALAGLPPEKNWTRCTECGKCEEKCPNKLAIRDTLKLLAKLQ